MYMVVVGVLLLLAKFFELGPVATWSWWIVLAPFAVAVLWWEYADSSGWTARRVMDKMEKRKRERREVQMEVLGTTPRRDRVRTRAQTAKARQVSADPTFAGRDAPRKPTEPEPPRREPRL